MFSRLGELVHPTAGFPRVATATVVVIRCGEVLLESAMWLGIGKEVVRLFCREEMFFPAFFSHPQEKFIGG